MSVVVQKYGGSSVSDLAKIRGVADRIACTVSAGHRVVVVVSAMGNTTNELLSLAAAASEQPDRRELDMLLSVGERITMALLAMCLKDRGVRSRSLTGSQSGIITNEAHADATVVEVRPARLKAVLEAGEVAIVAGFQGVSREREVTTLGRGGSDTTAVVLAAALGAEWCEICSDVDGVYSADPRVVDGAERLESLSLDEAVALARCGAKVLFEDAVRFARDHGVQIVATSTFGPGAGTRLVSERSDRNGAAAVSADAALRWAEGSAAEAAGWVVAGGRLRQRVGTRWLLDERNAHGALDAVGRPVAMVSAVGSGLGEQPQLGAEAAMASFGVIACGASGDTIWWLVERSESEAAVRALHEVLCSGS